MWGITVLLSERNSKSAIHDLRAIFKKAPSPCLHLREGSCHQRRRVDYQGVHRRLSPHLYDFRGMSLPPLVPPLKCQGIKTKLAGEISRIAQTQDFERWVEPFCGSCVVALNVQPKKALLSDSNVHIVRLYQEIQNGSLTPGKAKSFLAEEGK